MTWVSYQKKRIEIENSIIKKYFPAFRFYYNDEIAYWEGYMFTNSCNIYEIRVTLPENYPEDVPKAYIIYPCPLYNYNGVLITKLGTNHEMHTFRSENEYVRMCIFRPERWSADYTVYKCLKKTRIWIEAFDRHKKTGERMCDILKTQA